VADAVSEGYDTTRAFRNELKGYRDQLAENYLTDTQTKETFLRQAYDRSLIEVNAWHILIAIPQDASPSDTLKAWEKAIDVRTRIVKGESFEIVARATSDDKSVKTNGGNLGYFSVFQMIMPFEDAAYTLKTGVISMPVRSPYGYHLIKVADRRASKGKIKVAHIMKAVPPGTPENEAGKAKEEINNVYDLLQNGSSFGELARKYSDHKESAVKGGELNWFGTGEIMSDFSEPAFSLTDTGKYTIPIHTIYGWHIIKLSDRKAPGSYEETRSFLESRVNQTFLNSLSKKSFVAKLKKEYNFKINKDSYNWLVSNADTLIVRGQKKYERSAVPAGNIYSFANQHLSVTEFALYIEKSGTMVVTKDSAEFISKLIDLRAADHLTAYENSVLETKYPDFRYLINEFHDGMLLFAISEKKIWNRVSSDSTGLHGYYEANRGRWPASSGFSDVQEEVMTGYQELLESEWLVQLNKSYNVMIDNAVMDEVKKKLIK